MVFAGDAPAIGTTVDSVANVAVRAFEVAHPAT